MPIQEPVAGIPVAGTKSFTAIAVDAQGNAVSLVAGIVPTWSKDTTDENMTVSTDGFTATVSATSNPATAGTTFGLSVSATFDSTTIARSIEVPIYATGPVGFVIVENS